MGIKKSRKPVSFKKDPSFLSSIVAKEAVSDSVMHADKSVVKVISSLISSPHLLHGNDKDGVATLTAIFPGTIIKGVPLRINLSSLLKVPNLTEPLSEYYLKSQRDAPNVNTASTDACRLGTGLVAYLIESGRAHISLSDLSVSMANGYLSWLDRADSEGNAISSIESRRTNYAILKKVVRILRDSPRWGRYISPALELPGAPWAGKSGLSKPTTVISAEDMTLIRLKCIELVKGTVDTFYSTKQLVDSYGPLPPLVARRNKWTLEKFLVAVNEHCADGPILAQPQLPKHLAQVASRYGWGNIRNDIAPRFHAVTMSLVPFVILMAIASAYNPDTIRNALLTDFRFEDEFGNWFVLDAFKGRAGTEQPVYIPVDDEYDNPAFLYKFLVEYTARVRKFARPDAQGKLFIGSSRMDMSIVIDIDGGLWPTLLKEFIKDHGLPTFALKSIRPTVLDVTADVYGGDLKAVQIQANHKSVQTTYTRYTSDAKKQKDYERLGIVQQLRERWRESKGAIDSRDRGTSEDVNCATPGWECVDPFDSPLSSKGKLCNSYGHCPRCPLGRIDLNSPIAFAFSIALREAVNSAQHTMAAETWLAKMGQVKVALEQKWLPSFTAHAVEAAKALQIPKLPIPE